MNQTRPLLLAVCNLELPSLKEKKLALIGTELHIGPVGHRGGETLLGAEVIRKDVV
jgi:hypothetical protein